VSLLCCEPFSVQSFCLVLDEAFDGLCLADCFGRRSVCQQATNLYQICEDSPRDIHRFVNSYYVLNV
jgi:hypothetical protein